MALAERAHYLAQGKKGIARKDLQSSGDASRLHMPIHFCGSVRSSAIAEQQ